MVNKKAWANQSTSLVEAQKKGGGLEKAVTAMLGWKGGTIIYDNINKYRFQIDAAFPDTTNPELVISITYTDPDKRGHSNENKFQLKVGELVLIKSAYPKCRVVLVLGGTREAWLSYVLNAFQVFFDEVIFLWEEAGQTRLKEIKTNPETVPLKHPTFWESIRQERLSRVIADSSFEIPYSSVRYTVMDALKAQPCIVYNPTLIENEVAQLCLRRSYDADGTEWESYLKQRWHAIEMSRNYFNPVEATVEISLRRAGLKFEGGIARDIMVESLLHDLGMPETKLSEDFILYSKKLKQKVYIQCKASGGGRTQHGKNIQNRAKEQTTRGILYSCRSRDGKDLVWNKKNFHWIGILDGNWGVTRSNPLKYIHLLQMAGYDKLIPASQLLSSNLSVHPCSANSLVRYLVEELHCEKAPPL